MINLFMSKNKDVIVIKNTRKLYLPFYFMIIVLGALIGFLEYNDYNLNLLIYVGYIIFILIGFNLTEMHRMMNKYEFTSDVLVHTFGIFSRKQRQIHYNNFSHLDVVQTFWQRLLDYGDVNLKMFSDEIRLSMKDINNPKKIADLLERKRKE